MYARVIRGTKDFFFLIQKNQLSFVLANGKTTRGKNDREIEYGEDNDDDITYH